jgi:hypothetical protein
MFLAALGENMKVWRDTVQSARGLKKQYQAFGQ